MSKKIDARLFAHPYVRSNGPSLRPDHLPWRTAAGGGQGWPQGHREAAPSVLEGHQPPCDAGDRRALGYTSASHESLTGIGKRKWEAHQKAGRRSHQLSCSCSTRDAAKVWEREERPNKKQKAPGAVYERKKCASRLRESAKTECTTLISCGRSDFLYGAPSALLTTELAERRAASPQRGCTLRAWTRPSRAGHCSRLVMPGGQRVHAF